MDFKRADRVGDLVKEELADIILRKIKDPRVGFVTITGVKVSDDLKHARVYVSVLGNEKNKKDTLAGLKSAGLFIRSELGRRIKLRSTPELSFFLDETMEKASRMIEKLNRLAEGGPEDGPEDEEDSDG